MKPNYDDLLKENAELKQKFEERHNSLKNIIRLVLSLLSTLFAMGIAYALSRYFEDMSGAVLFISGLLIGEYLKKERFDI